MNTSNQKKRITHSIMPSFKPGFAPNTVEIFDEKGLLVKIERGKIVEQYQRDKNHRARVIAWYFDGKQDENIALMFNQTAIYVNRITACYQNIINP